MSWARVAGAPAAELAAQGFTLLSAFGVAGLAPAASNSGEEGHAKNRRVELVPQ